MHACIKMYGTKVTHDFLISALDDAILFLRVSGGEGMHDLRQACKLCEELVVKGGALVSVNDIGSVEICIARTYDFLLKLIKQLYRTTCIESITN